jgi:Uma2 family endonuclease
MVVQSPTRVSVADYYRMAAMGELSSEARVELLDGRIIDRAPVGSFHGGMTNYLTEIFASANRRRWVLTVQNPVRLDDFSEPQPDLMLLHPAADYYQRLHPGPSEVFLLVEVADSSLTKDRELKLPAHGRAGIAEVWIVCLAEQTLEVYREPHFTGYRAKTILRAGDQARPQAFPDVVVEVRELLRA